MIFKFLKKGGLKIWADPVAAEEAAEASEAASVEAAEASEEDAVEAIAADAAEAASEEVVRQGQATAEVSGRFSLTRRVPLEEAAWGREVRSREEEEAGVAEVAGAYPAFSLLLYWSRY